MENFVSQPGKPDMNAPCMQVLEKGFIRLEKGYDLEEIFYSYRVLVNWNADTALALSYRGYEQANTSNIHGLQAKKSFKYIGC